VTICRSPIRYPGRARTELIFWHADCKGIVRARYSVPGEKPLPRLPSAFRSSLVLALLALSISLAATPARASMEDSALCQDAIAGAEARHDIPSQLLMAMAPVETGRWDEQAQRVVPWLWTVYARGEGRYFTSAADATAEVERLRASGCAQHRCRLHAGQSALPPGRL
jgi:hypothetical protein